MVEMALSRNSSSPKLRVKTCDSSVIFVAHKWFHCEHLEGTCKVSAVAKTLPWVRSVHAAFLCDAENISIRRGKGVLQYVVLMAVRNFSQ